MSNAYVPHLSTVYIAHMSIHDNFDRIIHGTERKLWYTQELVDKLRAANKHYANASDEDIVATNATFDEWKYSCDKVEVTEDYV